MRYVPLLLLLPSLARAASEAEYRQYFNDRAQEDQAAACERMAREDYTYALNEIAREAARYASRVAGELTRGEGGECRRLTHYYATLSNGMRCDFNPIVYGKKKDKVFCR